MIGFHITMGRISMGHYKPWVFWWSPDHLRSWTFIIIASTAWERALAQIRPMVWKTFQLLLGLLGDTLW